ncbi:DUF1152 domain-containing protein [Sandaracinus amylolyticus]|uniref:DUF1152 domain-containing protein n=1 Tax=Sandaracinus amylolyticus TaxID=927083 RepID=UPI003AF3C484
MMSLAHSPLVTRLGAARRILIAGAGGGYDVYCGVPLFLALRAQGKDVHLANLSFTYLADTDALRTHPVIARVDARTRGAERYFPEQALCELLSTHGVDTPIHCFEKVGVAPLRDAYAELARTLDLDAIVLVDGGTDILMRGDEPGLGTPEEDATSLAAVAGLESIPHRLVACLGFGIDHFHGVSHVSVLEAVAALQRENAFLGAFSLLPSMPEARVFLDAVEHAERRFPRGSIVNGSIASALTGEFGDVQRLARTERSELFVSPLMCLYWTFELEALARRSLYLAMLEGTETIFEVSARIEAFRRSASIRPRRPMPL